MSDSTLHLLALSILVISLLYHIFARHRRRSGRLPPGPAALPLIGSLFDVLRDKSNPKPQYLKYLEMGQKYKSEIVHMKVLGDRIIILNSAKAANELLEKRSAIYSSRPSMPMLVDLSGWCWNFGFFPYSESWRAHRRTFSRYFMSRKVQEYHPIQRKETLHLLKNLVNDPDNTREHVRTYTGAISVRITHGINLEQYRMHYSKLAERGIQSIIFAGIHGDFMVDYFPLLKHIPAWLPGATFKQKAKVWAKDVTDLNELPWKDVKSSIASGDAIPCIATDGLEKFSSQLDEMEEVLKNVCGVSYIAGTDTTSALLLSIIAALVCYPEIQKKAQAELDTVVGQGRLPDFGDRKRLPYIECILKETQRMWPSVPLGLDHYSISDDIYEGYFIPKGAIIVGNTWAILHDKTIYDDPMTFKPERFLEQFGKQCPPDPLYSFGFGRRICPGRYLALDNSWMMMACILAVFTIEKALDINGNEIEVTTQHADGALSYPVPFRCRFTPRSPQALGLLETGFAGQEVAE
ncbi:cytochrome P450 [Dendrothele bispora CBS 962.96]|uniref:Cytochrome P450 n=1 Tax=Dendrothele bispora (strain CBS 962.96) TaxID=1314807 RepID=A0A4S8L8R6_DENBC|nr:cytochrome P450 [Dendrothele bispora CBS 962.96]